MRSKTTSFKRENLLSKMNKILLTIMKWIAAITLCLIIISVGTYLLESDIVKLNHKEITKYFYYFGLGILSWYPCQGIINYSKRLK